MCRLTASNHGDICKATDRRDMFKLSESIFSGKQLTAQASNWGKLNEENAIRKFVQITGKAIEPCGFHVHPTHPYIGASPDGFVVHEDACIEASMTVYVEGLLM